MKSNPASATINTRPAQRACEIAGPDSMPRSKHARGLCLAAILALIAVMPACKRQTPRTGTEESTDHTGQATAQTGTISADPNPVPAGSGKGKTKINWSVNEGTGQVYVSIDGDKEVLFSGASGAEAPWIEEGHDYEFRLYADTEHKTRLGTVNVVRKKQ